MSEETVDVLIVGAGAAGAAIAWSLADTRMNVLCMEQGDWMDPAQYPSTRLDWDLGRFGEFGLSPNSRGRETDYPVNDSYAMRQTSVLPLASHLVHKDKEIYSLWRASSWIQGLPSCSD